MIRENLAGAFVEIGSLVGTPESLARAAREPLEATLEELAEMEVEHLIETLEADGGLLVTLTIRGAEALGLKPAARSGVPMWVPLDAAEPALDFDPLRGVDELFRTYQNIYCGGNPGDGIRIDRDVVAGAVRDWVGPLRFDRDGTPVPTILLERPLWDSLKVTPCRTCKDRPLGMETTCLECDRWGIQEAGTPSRA